LKKPVKKRAKFCTNFCWSSVPDSYLHQHGDQKGRGAHVSVCSHHWSCWYAYVLRNWSRSNLCKCGGRLLHSPQRVGDDHQWKQACLCLAHVPKVLLKHSRLGNVDCGWHHRLQLGHEHLQGRDGISRLSCILACSWSCTPALPIILAVHTSSWHVLAQEGWFHASRTNQHPVLVACWLVPTL
jgi:hypothetical protein